MKYFAVVYKGDILNMVQGEFLTEKDLLNKPESEIKEITKKQYLDNYKDLKTTEETYKGDKLVTKIISRKKFIDI